MITDTDLYVLAQINSGLRSDMLQLHELDSSLQQLIDEAKSFPGAAGHFAGVDWENLTASLMAVRHHARLIDESLAKESGDTRRSWKAIVQYDAQVEAVLLRLRVSARATLPAEHQQHWGDLWRTIFLQLATIHAHVAMAQARVEMRGHYGAAKTDEMAQYIVKHLPANSNIAEAAQYADEYRKAFVEYQDNKEVVGGFMGIARALLLLPDEAPETVARRRMADMRSESMQLNSPQEK